MVHGEDSKGRMVVTCAEIIDDVVTTLVRVDTVGSAPCTSKVCWLGVRQAREMPKRAEPSDFRITTISATSPLGDRQ